MISDAFVAVFIPHRIATERRGGQATELLGFESLEVYGTQPGNAAA
jgi:hypothetical protein